MDVSRRNVLGLAGGVVGALATGRVVGGGAPAIATGELTDFVIAHTRNGALRGARHGDVVVWKGVRFAEAPSGRYRFAPPRPVQPWAGIRDALEFGSEPLQFGSASPNLTMVEPRAEQSEDCLFLNVWSRATTGRRPVIVWITGGGFMGGAGSWYDGTIYAQRHDVVLVTINYRVNAFGYLYQSRRPGSGNAGLMDQITALHWVRNNIAAFGGDPHNVTVMGESAGAMSIGVLLGTPAAKGLFHRAIVQSGGVVPALSPQGKDKTTNVVLEHLGLDPGETDKLIEIPADDLLDAADKAASGTAIRTQPFHLVIDGAVLPTHPLDLVSGEVDLLIGTCDKDYILQLPHFSDWLEFAIRYGAGDRSWDRLLRVYQDTTSPGRDPYLDLIASGFVGVPSIWLAERAHRLGAQVWQYTFDYRGASPQGALHATDVFFTFAKPDPQMLDPDADPAVAQKLADQMVSAFSTFARTGTPTADGLPDWPAFTPQDRATLSFDAPPHIKNDRLLAERRQAWSGIDPHRIW